MIQTHWIEAWLLKLIQVHKQDGLEKCPLIANQLSLLLTVLGLV